MNYGIKEIQEKDFEIFYPLVGEIEIGSLYEVDNAEHKEWLVDKVHSLYAMGVTFFAYWEDDTPIGITGVKTEKTLKSIPYVGRKSELIYSILFAPYRRKGHGSSMVRQMEQYAKKAGAYCMYVATWATDYETVAFYGKNGFMPVATLPDVNGADDVGKLYMRKLI